jgi:hypothetical protein
MSDKFDLEAWLIETADVFDGLPMEFTADDARKLAALYQQRIESLEAEIDDYEEQRTLKSLDLHSARLEIERLNAALSEATAAVPKWVAMSEYTCRPSADKGNPEYVVWTNQGRTYFAETVFDPEVGYVLYPQVDMATFSYSAEPLIFKIELPQIPEAIRSAASKLTPQQPKGEDDDA